jgi:tetratricopeptide (TPR) repeat protein
MEIAMQYRFLIPLILALAPGLPAFAPSAQEPAGGAGETAEATMLKLKDGGILWGTIVSHDEESLRFRRLDTQGIVGLGWSFLDPDQAEELRGLYGYLETGSEELTVDADKLYFVDGTERVGLITERTPTELWLKTADGRIPIPLQRLAGPTTVVQVPALDVYTKEELYTQKLFELQAGLLAEGAEAAAAHFEVARFCEGLLDYEKALEHYQAVVRLDPTFEPGTMPATLKRAEEKAAVQSQVDLLQEIDLWRARRQYPKATADIQRFQDLYPDSPLQEDLQKLRARVAKYQERDLREEVVRSWHHWTRRLAQTAARKMGYQEAVAYLDGAMAEDILKKVEEDLVVIAPEIKPEDARKLWEERKGGRLHQASYGDGTWLLGEGRALAELKGEGEEEEPEQGTQDDARKKIAEQMARYLKNQEIARKAEAGGASEDEDPEAFWGQWPSANRTQWVLASYVEDSGDFELTRVRFRNCRECGGTGTRQVIYTGGAVEGAESGQRIVPCPTCHKLGRVRMLKYR